MSSKGSRSSNEGIEMSGRSAAEGCHRKHALFRGQPMAAPPTLDERHHEAKKKTPAQLSQESRSSSIGLNSTNFSAELNATLRSYSSQPLSAQYALQQFIQHPSDHTPRKQSSRQAIDGAEQRAADAEVLKRFKAYQAQQRFHDDPLTRCTSWAKTKVTPPDQQDLINVVHNAFPPRMELPVLVCDVYTDSSTITCGRVGDIESLWKAKPENAVMRWIHAPIGQGLMHSSIEDMFRYDWEPVRPFVEAGGVGFPYLELDAMHFREREEIQHQRDVYKQLHTEQDLSQALKNRALDGDHNDSFQADLTWREIHRAKDRSFWDLATPDIPLELSEHLAFHSHDGPLRPLGLDGDMDQSVLSNKTKQFEHAQAVIAPFRCFHRSDNILLTMSAATGVDQLHKHFDVDLKEPLLHRLLNRDSSVIGNMMAWLKETGARDWYDHSVEWFLVYLISELGIAPNNMTSGRAGSSVLSALQCAVQDLADRRFKPWERDATVRLIKDFISCLDELKLLSISNNRKLSFFERLEKDLESHYDEDQKGRPGQLPVNNAAANTALQRARWAASILRDEVANVDNLFEDVKQAREALFQLGSLDQSQRAIATELNNRAVLIFTAVAVIFMPLSVFTSYFGMNLVDIRQSAWTQREFWKSLGIVAICIVLIVASVSIRYTWFWPANMVRRLQRRREAKYAPKSVTQA